MTPSPTKEEIQALIAELRDDADARDGGAVRHPLLGASRIRAAASALEALYRNLTTAGRDGFMKAREAAAKWHDERRASAERQCEALQYPVEHPFQTIARPSVAAFREEEKLHTNCASAIRSIPLPTEMEEEKVGDDGWIDKVTVRLNKLEFFLRGSDANESAHALVCEALALLPSKDIQDGD